MGSFNTADKIVQPNYKDGNIVNLMTSLALGLGGRVGPYPALKMLPPEQITRATQVILLVIDGLGYNYFQYQATLLKPYLRGRLTSVFPTSTAPAITTFMTGVAPQQHAVTGWFMYLKELGSVATILPFRPRWGEVSFTTAGIQVTELIGWKPLTESMNAATYHLLPRALADSAYSVACAGRATRVGYENWPNCLAAIANLVQKNNPNQRCYIYAYWPQLDALCHQHGVASRAARDHIVQLEQGIGELIKTLHGSQTLLIVTADHGFIDTGPHLTEHMEQHPALTDCLAVPLCGEPRLAYCYLRPGRVAQFKHYIQARLNQQCALYPSTDLLGAGWFGLGKPEPRLVDRIGDYILITRNCYALKDALPTETPWHDIGVHGGVSEDELYVPLITAYC